MFTSTVKVIRVVFVAALAIVFGFLGAKWFRSTHYYTELRFSESSQCFAWIFISALYSSLAVVNRLFRLLPGKGV